jgi:hypothetical protein
MRLIRYFRDAAGRIIVTLAGFGLLAPPFGRIVPPGQPGSGGVIAAAAYPRFDQAEGRATRSPVVMKSMRYENWPADRVDRTQGAPVEECLMDESGDLRTIRIPLKDGAGQIPATGFGTLIADPGVTLSATRDALDAGFRHFDCAERYRNEREVGEAFRTGFRVAGVTRKDVFVTTKLWNTNHRPERVQPALEASLDRLGLDDLDLYLMHTPFAFQPGDT